MNTEHSFPERERGRRWTHTDLVPTTMPQTTSHVVQLSDNLLSRVPCNITPPHTSVLVGGAAFGSALYTAGAALDALSKTELGIGWSTIPQQELRHMLIRILKRFPSFVAFTLSRSFLFGIASTTKVSCLQYESLSQAAPYSGGLMPAVLITGITFGTTGGVVDSFLASTRQSQRHSNFTKAIDSPGLHARRTRSLLCLSSVPRGTLLLATFYVASDTSERHLPGPVSSNAFLRGGLCGTLATAVAFPLQSCLPTPSHERTHRVANLYKGFGVWTMARSFLVFGIALQTYTVVESSFR